MKTITRIRNNKSSLAVVLLLVATSIAVYALQMNQDNRSKASGNFTATSGRPFADNSAWNQPIGSNVQIDPNSAAIVAKLASGKQGASLYDFGTPIFFADASTPKYNIDCTQDWGNCGLEAEPVPIPDDAQQAPGSDAQMVIVDLAGRKSYEFWIYNNDKASANWGAILPLDGDGRGAPDNSAIGAGTSRLAGIIRTYEIEQGIIDHALVFSTKFCQGPTNSSNFRYPATKTDGKYEGTGAIPEGARVQLDPSIDVNSIDGISKGEKAVAVALQKYGAYAVDCGGAEMAIQFENPIGKNDPYPSAGLTHDYFEFDKIPWDRLRVLREWNSYTPITNSLPTVHNTNPTFPAPKTITPTLYCLSGEPCTSPAPSQPNAPSNPNPSNNPNQPTPPSSPNNPNPPGSQPCSDQTSSLTNGEKKRMKYRENGGGFFQRFFQALFEFILRLIELILGGVPGAPENPNLPDNPNNPNDPNPPTQTPCPEPTSATVPTKMNPAPTAKPGTGDNTVPVGSKVVFVGDYNTGNFNQWSTCQWKGMNSSCDGYNSTAYMATIVNDEPGHETAARYEVRQGDEPEFGGERSEVTAGNVADVKEGDERWYEFSLKFPTDFPNPKGGWFLVMQWHPGSGSPPLGIEVNNSGVLEFSGSDNVEIAPIKRGQWVDYVLHIKFSNSTSSGYVEAWENGVKKVNRTGYKSMSSGSSYLKQGIYRGDQSLTHVVLHDGLRITAP